jgi:hypothetical protein
MPVRFGSRLNERAKIIGDKVASSGLRVARSEKH